MRTQMFFLCACMCWCVFVIWFAEIWLKNEKNKTTRRKAEPYFSSGQHVLTNIMITENYQGPFRRKTAHLVIILLMIPGFHVESPFKIIKFMDKDVF